MRHGRDMGRVARYLFWLALLVSFVFAVLPKPPSLPGDPPDKVQHILAFATLGALGAYGFRAVSLRTLLAGLFLFGGLIEVVQAIPALNRSSELADFVADAIAATLAALATRWLLARQG
jgi:VanZ family protein